MEIITHQTFKDNRGSYTPIPLDILGSNWTQCSISVNEHSFTFRGLHYQTNPPQTKYVKVVKGLIVDIIVDLETNDVDFAVVGENDAVFISKTKAHGFLTLVPDTIVVYLVEGEYNPSSEHSLVWSNNEKVKELINSFVGNNKITISEKDELGK
jgi:dTDP-4-dehydrorhamnose 3,5-epimerase-like enzyme